MKAGEIYIAPSGKKFEAVSDKTLPNFTTICAVCACMDEDCLRAPCNDIHFKLIKDKE